MAPQIETSFCRLIKLYLFDRPEGEYAAFILADLIPSEWRYWLRGILVDLVKDGEVIKVASPTQPLYRLSASAWLHLIKEEPEWRIRALKKLKVLPI